MDSKTNFRVVWASLLVLTVVVYFTSVTTSRFLQMMEKSREGSAKGSLGSLKSAASVYFGDSHGVWPQDLRDLVPKYLKEIPILHLEKYGHPPSNQVETYPFLDSTGKIDATKLKDTAHWLYDSTTGTVLIDCTHKDALGNPVYKNVW